MTPRLLWSTIAFSTMAAVAAAQPPAPPSGPQPPVVVVRGEGEVRAAPDVAYIALATEHRASTAKDAQSQGAAAMAAVQQRLAAAGVAKDAIRTLSYDLQPQFDFVDGRQVLRGYLARNAIEVRVEQVARVGELLEAAVSAGGTTVQGIRFDVKDRTQLELQAMRLAVADGRARAEAAAVGAGAAIVAVVRVEEAGVQVRPIEPAMMRMSADMAAAAPPPPIVAGEVVVTANVTVTATIK